MANPKQVLNAKDYRNYRNVRAVAVLFLLFGGMFVLSAVSMIQDPRLTQIGRIYLVVLACFGATGVIGGIGTLKGSRRWAPFVRVMATFYLLGFPIGTILAYTLLTRLSGYLDSLERIKMQETEFPVAGPQSQ